MEISRLESYIICNDIPVFQFFTVLFPENPSTISFNKYKTKQPTHFFRILNTQRYRCYIIVKHICNF